MVVHSAHSPVLFNAPLLVRFGKVRYPSYRILKDAGDGELVEGAPSIFASRRVWRQWEVSCELRHYSDLLEMAEEQTADARRASHSLNCAEGTLLEGHAAQVGRTWRGCWGWGRL